MSRIDKNSTSLPPDRGPQKKELLSRFASYAIEMAKSIGRKILGKVERGDFGEKKRFIQLQEESILEQSQNIRLFLETTKKTLIERHGIRSARLFLRKWSDPPEFFQQ